MLTAFDSLIRWAVEYEVMVGIWLAAPLDGPQPSVLA